jgi:hypothetical protein
VVAHHRDVICVTRCVDGAALHRECGIGDIDHAQSTGAVSQISQVAHHLHVERVAPGHVERAELQRECGVGDVDDAQSGGAFDHVGEVAHHLDVQRPVRRVEGANLYREGGVGDVDDAQATCPV